MKPEAQIIAIAEACGYVYIPDNQETSLVWKRPNGVWASLPDYLHDLNAMHEVEKVLDKRQRDIYATMLGQIVECGWADLGAKMVIATTQVVSATASQRAEAFLRTIGKWVEE